MFEFLIPVSIFGFGGYFMYKIFELYGMRSERKTIIERLESSDLADYAKRMPIGVGGGNIKPVDCEPQTGIPAKWPLRWGLAAMGLGIGLICGFLISSQNEIDKSLYSVYEQVELIYSASAFVGVGLGLFISFIIETILAKTSKE